MTAKKPILLILIILLVISSTACATAPENVSIPETDPTNQSTVQITTDPPTEPTEPPTEAPTEPPDEAFILSFAGDCCLANLKTWSKDRYFMGTVGTNYEYPFAAVQDYFAADDCTFVNLECVFTESTSSYNKQFVFKGPPAYSQILSVGSVEFANIVNNHTMDYGQVGYDDTAAALDDVGIPYAHQRDTRIFTTESGLTIGVYADNNPKNIDGLKEKIDNMRAEGAELIVVSMHWGAEYYYAPNQIQIDLGHGAIDAGADIVFGTHPHVLQPIEEYNGKYIYYSLGNFSFGGNTNPADKDTAIIQQQVIRKADGSIHLGELTIIPCSVSSTENTNDFQPTPMEPNTEAYDRVLSKLNGTYGKTKISVTYRPELG